MNRTIEALYASGGVRRMHTLPVREQQTVAAHTFGAQVIAVEIAKKNGLSTGPILEWLLYHDVPEVATGDMPAHVKRTAGIGEVLEKLEEDWCRAFGLVTRVLGEKEKLAAKAADTLDLLFTMLHERRTGNFHPRIEEVFERGTEYLEEARKELKGVEELVQYLKEEWANA